jgi:lipooligosaccharide transport system ATP-binding protein
MAAEVIKVENVSKSFGRVLAVQSLNFSVDESTCYGFLGPNGAGKTTMMKILYGRATRDGGCAGLIDVFGFDPCTDELSIKSLSGVVPQEDNLDEELNVVGNLMIYAKLYGIPAKVAKDRIARLLDFMELGERAKARIRELSGGMKRRLVIARALLNEPRLLILDEPTTGLDPQVRHLIWDKMRQLKRQGTTILLTTHYMEEAFQLCDRILIMHKGRRVMEGAPKQLLDENVEKYVLELLEADELRALSGEAAMARVRIDDSQAVKRLYSDSVEELRGLAGALGGGQYYLRQANLEDVFLKATGRGLDDKQ